MNHHRKLRTAARVIVALGVASSIYPSVTARAHCDQTQVSTSDQDLWNLHGCWQDYFDWQADAYDVKEEDWSDRGYHDACNQKLEYPKHWNATYLLDYAVPGSSIPTDNMVFGLVRPFHSSDDYLAEARAESTDQWHASLRHQAQDGYAYYGLSLNRSLKVNLLQTFCALYDNDQPVGINDVNFVSTRASIITHEGWHHWQYRHVTWNNSGSCDKKIGHDYCSQNNTAPKAGTFCTQSACDDFHPHMSNEFASGALWTAGLDVSPFPLTAPNIPTYHSVYQVQIETECDIADFSTDRTPFSVREMAAEFSKSDSRSQVPIPPPFYCGSTRPFWGKNPHATPGTVPACLDGTRTGCRSDGTCAAGFAGGCGADGCCVPTCAQAGKQCQASGSAFACATSGDTCSTTDAASGCCESPVGPIR